MSEPLEPLLAFCREEYQYYDAIPSLNPNSVDPIDILATVAMNSFVNSAVAVRRVHRAMAQYCNPVLAVIPETADLLTCDDTTLDNVRQLFLAAVHGRGVLIPVAAKVLHRKRRALIPMLDRVVVEYYKPGYIAKMQDKGDPSNPQHEPKRQAIANRALDVLCVFRVDLQQCIDDIATLQRDLQHAGFPLTPLRILELLVWIHTEPSHYYAK